jgi:hypothetical protein
LLKKPSSSLFNNHRHPWIVWLSSEKVSPISHCCSWKIEKNILLKTLK